MEQERKWRLASAKLNALLQNAPQSIEEQLVVEFHQILNLFAEATGEDVAPFRVPDKELKREITSAQRINYSGRLGRVTYSDRKYCDRNLFLRKAQEVKEYFANIQSPERSRLG
jgi:hypothetical protein